MRARVLATTSVAAVSLALSGAWGGVAFAQDEEEEAAERIVVTGSRILRRDFESNSPIVTIEAETFQNRSSFNLEAALNQLPQFTPEGTSNVALGNPATTFAAQADSAPGAATLNLRNLGSNRGLVLVNGRRPQPANAQLVVDVNSIPSAAVERVEVITGGAGAVYGADAIAGAVNFWLRDDFEGFELDGQYGMAEVGDNKETQVSALIGGNFADGRGNAVAAVVWSQRGEAYNRDREFYTRGWNDPGTTGTGFALGTYARPGVISTSVGGVTWIVNPDGTLSNQADVLDLNTPNPLAVPHSFPLNALAGGAGFKLNPPDATTGRQTLSWNDPDALLSIPSTRYSVYTSGHYDLTDSVTAFVEGTFTNNYTSVRNVLFPPATFQWLLSIPYNQANDDPDSPTFGATPNTWHPVSPQLADLLNSRPNQTWCLFGAPGCGVPGTVATPDSGIVGTILPGTQQPWNLTQSLEYLGDPYTNTTTEVYQVTGGFEGDLPLRDWTWEAYGSHGLTHVYVYQPTGYVSQPQLQSIFSGRAFNTTNPTLPLQGAITATGPWGEGWNNGFQAFTVGTCATGIPLFDNNGIPSNPIEVSQDCKDYVNLEFNSITEVEQDIVEASLQGSLFELPWAGEVRFAVGATYRESGFFFNPDAAYASSQPRNNVINATTLPLATVGSFDVSEVFGELLVPVIADVPLIQNLELELGYRYSDYSTAGGVDTYKMLADWTVDDWLRFRGGYQHANRAPNLFELFSPIAPAFRGGNPDPCSNITTGFGGGAPTWGNRDGNPNRVNVQEACRELILRGNNDGGPGGFRYRTLLDDINDGVPLNTGQPEAQFGMPGFDDTHMSNFRWHQGNARYGAGGFGGSTGLDQGNPDLESEVAETWTLGAVFSSPFEHALLDRLRLSIDWYQIEIEDTVAAPDYIFVYQQCLDPQFNPLIAATPGSVTGTEILAGNPFCDFINRQPFAMDTNALNVPGTGINRNYDAKFINQGGTQTAGVDVQVNWGAEFDDLGPLQAIPGGVNINVLASFLNEWAEQGSQGSPWTNYTDTASPQCTCYQWRLFSTIGYSVGDVNTGLRIRYLPEIGRAVGSTAEVLQFPVTSYTQVDLFGRWRLNETLELRGGVDNLLDEQPEVTGRSPTNNALSTTNGQFYDQIGRRYFVGLTARY